MSKEGKILSDNRRFVFENGNEFTAAIERNGSVYFSCYDEWAGDTETGFGARAACDLDKESALALKKWLNDNLKE